MKKIMYLFRRIKRMNLLEMFKTAKRISDNNDISFLYVLFDIIYCGLKYMAGYVDYETFNFVNLNSKQRETIITRGINNHFVSLLNNKEAANILDNKLLFNANFNRFLGRAWINLNTSSLQDFSNFVKNKKSIIVKPIDMSCGQNIEKFEIQRATDIAKLYNDLIQKKQFLVEDSIVQHPQMSYLYPNSVNTLRIVTITKNKKVNIMFRSIRMGNSGNIVDNFNHGGLFTTIEENGVIKKPAIDKKGNVYKRHPYTNTKIVDFQIPLFADAIKLAELMALSIPDVGYVGWDIAITEAGPIVVEANPFPGHDIYHSIIHTNDDGTGLRKKFEKIICEEEI